MDNPFVRYLNSLRTQAIGGNPSYVYENRAAFLEQLRGEWAAFPREDRLHVLSRIDGLADAMGETSFPFDLVVLTGDAGDGKTAFCARAAARLGHTGELEEETLAGTFTILRDASEITEEELLDRLVNRQRVLIAINEGRLRRLMGRVPRLAPELLEPALDVHLARDGAEKLDALMRERRVLVLNFRQRADPRGLTAGLLRSWTPEEYWEKGPACPGCAAKDRCPILANAQDLRRAGPAAGLGTVLTAAHYAGQRLPLRRLQAALALATTGGLDCEQVQGLAEPDALGYRYYSAIFAPAKKPIAVAAEWLCPALAPFDPGSEADRALDEKIVHAALGAQKVDGELPAFEARAIAQFAGAAGEKAQRPTEVNERLAVLVRSLRRLHVLEGKAPAPDWHRALRLLEQLSQTGESEELLKTVHRGLNRLQGVAHKDDALTAVMFDPGGFRDTSRLALSLDVQRRIETRLARGPDLPEAVARWIEAAPAELALVARPAGSDVDVRLPLDVHLLRALLACEQGFSMVSALGAYRHDLARFYGRLLAVAAHAGSDLTIILRPDEKSIRVRAAAHGRLSFNPM